MNPCEVDWMAWAAWIGALATVGLVVAAFRGLNTWKTQFIKQRDHDLALRILRAVSDSCIIFDELRSPVQLYSDSDVPLPPNDGVFLSDNVEHRTMFARYKARNIHLAAVRAERIVPVLEALSIWGDDDDNYAAKLGALMNSLAPIENRVLAEAKKYVDSLRPNGRAEGRRVNKDVLFSPAAAGADDQIASEYEAVKNEVLEQLQPKLKME